MITTKDFKTTHALSDSTFTRLVRRAQTDYPDLAITRKVSSQVWEVLEPDLLESYISKKPAAKQETESIDGEIIETLELCNGSQLTVRREIVPAPYVPPLQIQTEVKQTDLSKVDELIERLRVEIEAKNEVKRLAELAEFAQQCEAKKKNRDLVEMLIEQGYDAQTAVKIAQHSQNLNPVGK
ncbi:hypothetical protein [Leptolyngbya sp. FACHB-17]|uniref:hypothetical protein n=1 Tax=unclassified Leptolyngbya TaxID=2650499 RepID=UPI001681254A|nr:hypothetical protein [Leptolyngbya sp. FACHB-17]MBD2083369.1 hypothetical protein [Leptolyngbya sp. FACHB-17]